MKLRLVLVLLVLSLLAFPMLAPATTTEAAGGITVPITGTTVNGGTFNGVFTLTRFVSQNGTLMAVGTLSGTLTNALGAVLGTVTNVPIALPVASATGSCQVLHLTLGPLDLNLLGLQVHLNQVVLDITAQAGSGNLLGNLLCVVAHLLDNGGALTTLTGLLNRILAAL